MTTCFLQGLNIGSALRAHTVHFSSHQGLETDKCSLLRTIIDTNAELMRDNGPDQDYTRPSGRRCSIKGEFMGSTAVARRSTTGVLRLRRRRAYGNSQRWRDHRDYDRHSFRYGDSQSVPGRALCKLSAYTFCASISTSTVQLAFGSTAMESSLHSAVSVPASELRVHARGVQ